MAELSIMGIGMLVSLVLGLAVAAGFFAGLLGIGGGIILVPGLYYIFHVLGFPPEHLMHVAVGTSLAVIIPTGLSSTRAHMKRHSVRMDLVRRIGIGIIVGVGAGTLLADHLSGGILKAVFSVAMIIFAVLMQMDPEKVRWRTDIPPQPWPGLAGFFIGTLATLLGIGGATLNVPYMSLHGVPMRQAIGSASAMGVMIAIPGAIGFMVIGWGEAAVPPYSLGFVNLVAAALIIPVSVAMAPLGAAMAHRVSVKFLRKLFAVFMVGVAVKMGYSVLTGG